MNSLREKLAWAKRTYSPVESSETLLPQRASSFEHPQKSSAYIKTNKPRFESLLATVSFICIAFVLGFFVCGLTLGKPSDRDCTKQISTYSPLIDVVEYEDRDFDNDFDHKTKYRGPPTPELEQAWHELWFYGGIEIPKEKIGELNRTEDLTYKGTLKPSPSGNGYHALIEVFHQLHCLNLIRQFTWRDYYKAHPDRVKIPADLMVDDVGSRMHVDHCIEALRITLMCHGDTTPYFVMDNPDAPFGMQADFSPHHKCVKFEPLVEYVKSNTIG
ncbi:MAG: hypothetical protein M1822_003783 [Bathelium mastoideum]|nr:MAG: hypothetical protein M1822_003783 [Bathelium mastoideum]